MMMHPEKDDEKLQEAVDDVDWGPEHPLNDQIGRASCRERV